MTCRKYITALCLILTASGSRIQGEEVYHTVEYLSEQAVSISSGDYLPYFMAANRHGVLSPQGSQGYIRGAIAYRSQREDRKFYCSAGADLIGYASTHYDYYRSPFYLQQIYAEIGGGQYFITLGSKEQPARFVDDVLSSGNMTWSGNTRPIPGLHIGTRDFVKMFIIADLLESSFDFFYGKMLDGPYNNARFDRYEALGEAGPLRASAAEGAYIHRKSIFLRTPSRLPFYVTAGVEHAALFGGTIRHIDGQWDGTRQEVRFDQSCKWGNALLGGEGHVDDALNHLMTIDARMDYTADRYSFGLYKQHYTDDLNSKSFSHFADGLWGMELKFRRFPWLERLVVEYIRTDSQGDNTEALRKISQGEEPLMEDFASDFYQDERFGSYSYYGMMCGHPMIASPIYNADGYTGLYHNNIRGFHLGASGQLNRDLTFVLKCCNIQSTGNPWTSAIAQLAGENIPSYSNTSVHLEMTYSHGNWDFTSQLSIDHGDLLGDNYGFGISARYSGKHMKAVWK